MRLRHIFSFLVLFLASTVFAQTGSITGQVFDAGGAAISSATVTATSESTGYTQAVTTTGAGLYNFGALPPAVYSIQVSAPGFQTALRKNVILTIAAALPLNFKLGVAVANTTIEVQNVQTAPVETDSFELSTVIDAKQMTSLPLILRDPYQLVLLSPGVVSSLNTIGGFAVNGQRDRNNNFLLDGADNNDTSVPGIPGGLTSANPDSAQEFRVITNGFDAEFGRNTGAIIDVITRGGTNTFHGDAYWFGRYNALGARDFFNTKANGPMDPYVRNDFGASVGGPIWKDRTFFFLNGEVQRFRTTLTDSTVTPTAAFRTGVFNYVGTDGTVTPVNLTNPATNPNNLSGLPLDPTIQKIFAVAPVGQQDLGDGVSTLYFFPSPDALNDYTLTGRFDHKLTSKHQLTVRYSYAHSNETDPFHDEVLPGYGNTSSPDTAHNGVISIASTISANAANVLRASYNQNNDGFVCNHAAFDALLGVDNFGNGFDVNVPGFFNGTAFGCFDLGDSNGQARLSSTLLFGDTFNLTKGRHSIKFGGEFRNVKDSNFDNFSSRALLALDNYLNFNASAYTFNGSPNDIEAFEDFIWGAQGSVANISENQFFTASGVRRGNDLTRFVQREWAVFGQDTLKVTPRFTLIAGLRYAFNGVPFERDGNFSNFYGDASVVTPPGGFVFTQVGPGTGHQLYKDSWNLWEPRVGFAYDPSGDNKTAVRGGFGIFHDRLFDNVFGNAKSNPPFQAQFNQFPFGTPGAFTVSSVMLPGNLTPSATITDGDFLQPVVIDPNLKMPTNYSWNLGIQREINPRLTGELNYVGSHTLHALREIDGNPPQPNLVQAALAAGVDPAALTNISLYTGGTDQFGNMFGPSVNNTAFYHELFQTSVVSGSYNALQATVKGQAANANITASYTYAHSLDNGSDPLAPGAGNNSLPRNPFDLGSEYGSSDFDTRHRATVAIVYDAPVGIGTAHLNHGLAGHILEGIEISGIETAQTGLPFDLRGTVDNLHTSLNNRPELIGNPYPSGRGTKVQGGVVEGPAASAFANAPFGESVSIRRNKFIGPGFVNTDAVFQKTQTIFEQAKLVFRVESYNLLNHPNFVTPGTSTISPGTITLGSSLFGLSTAQVGQNDGTTGARQIQAALKVVF